MAKMSKTNIVYFMTFLTRVYNPVHVYEVDRYLLDVLQSVYFFNKIPFLLKYISADIFSDIFQPSPVVLYSPVGCTAVVLYYMPMHIIEIFT